VDDDVNELKPPSSSKKEKKREKSKDKEKPEDQVETPKKSENGSRDKPEREISKSEEKTRTGSSSVFGGKSFLLYGPLDPDERAQITR
jgi:hypothetical protein